MGTGRGVGMERGVGGGGAHADAQPLAGFVHGEGEVGRQLLRAGLRASGDGREGKDVRRYDG